MQTSPLSSPYADSGGSGSDSGSPSPGDMRSALSDTLSLSSSSSESPSPFSSSSSSSLHDQYVLVNLERLRSIVKNPSDLRKLGIIQEVSSIPTPFNDRLNKSDQSYSPESMRNNDIKEAKKEWLYIKATRPDSVTSEFDAFYTTDWPKIKAERGLKSPNNNNSSNGNADQDVPRTPERSSVPSHLMLSDDESTLVFEDSSDFPDIGSQKKAGDPRDYGGDGSEDAMDEQPVGISLASLTSVISSLGSSIVAWINDHLNVSDTDYVESMNHLVDTIFDHILKHSRKKAVYVASKSVKAVLEFAMAVVYVLASRAKGNQSMYALSPDPRTALRDMARAIYTRGKSTFPYSMPGMSGINFHRSALNKGKSRFDREKVASFMFTKVVKRSITYGYSIDDYWSRIYLEATKCVDKAGNSGKNSNRVINALTTFCLWLVLGVVRKSSQMAGDLKGAEDAIFSNKTGALGVCMVLVTWLDLSRMITSSNAPNPEEKNVSTSALTQVLGITTEEALALQSNTSNAGDYTNEGGDYYESNDPEGTVSTLVGKKYAKSKKHHHHHHKDGKNVGEDTPIPKALAGKELLIELAFKRIKGDSDKNDGKKKKKKKNASDLAKKHRFVLRIPTLPKDVSSLLGMLSTDSTDPFLLGKLNDFVMVNVVAIRKGTQKGINGKGEKVIVDIASEHQQLASSSKSMLADSSDEDEAKTTSDNGNVPLFIVDKTLTKYTVEKDGIILDIYAATQQ